MSPARDRDTRDAAGVPAPCEPGDAGRTIADGMDLRGHTRWLASILTLTLAVPPPAAHAAPAGEVPLEQVSALVQEGQTRFDTADFAGAIELWTQAYAALPDDPAYSKRRNVLAYQIARACAEAYTLDPEQLIYLRKAERLFDNYLKTIDPRDAGTIAKVEATLAELREKIRAAEAEDSAAADTTRADAEAAAAAARKEREDREAAAARREADARRSAAAREATRARRLVITGAAVTGGGAVLLGVMAYGLSWGARVDRDGAAAVTDGVTDPARYQDLRDQGFAANRLATVTAAIGGTLVIVGVGLLAGGLVGKRRAGRRLALTPTWHPGGAGLGLSGRF